MASLRSLYSSAVSANVPGDVLAPAAPVLGTITMYQDTGVAGGRAKVTLNWTIPTKNRAIGGELLGTATGAAQEFESIYDPIENGFGIYEMSAAVGGEGYGDSVLSAVANRESIVISVVSGSNFAANDWVQIKEGTTEEYVQIASVATNDLTLNNYIMNSYTTSATVKEVNTATLKTVTTHYTINQTTGIINLVSEAFTASNKVVIKYETTLEDLGGFSIYRIPGNKTLGANPSRTAVLADEDVVTVDAAVSSALDTYEETLTAAENGETWSYYMFAYDDESSPNYSDGEGVMVEILTTIPQNLEKTVADAEVIVSWDEVTDDNADGYNIYRVTGSEWVDASAIKVNSAVIAAASPTFVDSANNVTNRRVVGEVAYPANGSAYMYKVESQDTTTSWSTGTNNKDSESGDAVTIAEKSA